MTGSSARALVAACLVGVLAACQTKRPEPPSDPPAGPAEGAAGPALAAIDWAAAPDCRGKLGLLVEANDAGHWRPDEQPPIAVVLSGPADGLDWLTSPVATVRADLPLEVYQRADPATPEVPCLVVVEPARDQRAAKRLLGHETVRSLYESGSRSQRNPEYDAAQLRLRQAERATKEKTPGILRVGDPLLDMVGLLVGGVISGFSQGSRERDVDQAMSALAATPRSVEQPVYRPYKFERETVLAGREATIPVALVDRANDRLWRAQLHRRERRQFEIVDGLDPRDRDYQKYSAASMSGQDFERWQNEPPQLELSAVVAALRDASATAGPEAVTAALDQLMQPPPPSAPPALTPTGSTAGPALEATDRRPAGHRRARPGDRTRPSAEPDRWIAGPDGIDGLVAQASAAGEPLAAPVGGFDLAPAAGPAPTPGGDPRVASIVRIIAGTRDGSAVYVRPDLVLTTAALVAGSAVVEIATADGMRVLGLVARADQARNLALVQVAHPGPPAALYDGPPAPGGGQVEGIALTDGAGVLVTPGRYRAGSGSAAADLAKIEVRAPPAQLEGLPWFLGDQVIAIGAGGGVGQGQGGVRAVQASEIHAFLYGAGGALAELR
jgi:hypothetical protein